MVTIYRFHLRIFTVLLVSFLICAQFYAQGTEIQITTSSKEALTKFTEGRNFFENLQFDKAAKMFDEALNLDKEFAMAHIYRALTNVGGTRVAVMHRDEAVKAAVKVTTGEKNFIMFSSANLDGNILKQKVHLNDLLSEFPKDKRVQTFAGGFYYFNQDYTTARKHLEAAIAIDRKYAPAYNMLGYTNSELGNMTEAETAFKTYISLIPNDPNPYDSYAELLLKNGKFEESIKQYKIAVEKDPQFVNALKGIGDNYIFMGKYDDARKYYQKAYDSSPNINGKISALGWISTSYVYQGNTDKALGEIDTQIKLARDNKLTTVIIGALNRQGFILTETGNTQKGMTKFTEAYTTLKNADLPKDMKETMTVNADLNKCYSLIWNNKLDEAQTELNNISTVISKRNNPFEEQTLHGTTALLEMKKGNYQQAVNHLNKSDLTQEVNQYYIATAYQKMGNTAKAKEYFDKVKNSRNNNLGLALVKSRAVE